MSENIIEIKEIINVAVAAALETGIKGLDEKIEAAINVALPVGIKVGAEVGSKIGAAAAVEMIEREQKKYYKQQYDWRYQNTKLLMRNYRRLNKYYENAVFSINDNDEHESFEEIMRNAGHDGDEKFFVESIQKNYLTTKIIMTHVNKMLECYEIMCRKSSRQEDKRHWRVLNGLYIEDDYTTATEIAKRECIDKRTVYRDIDICISDLTVLFFGVGGIERI